MTKASENPYPKVTFAESAAPSTPASGFGLLYEKTDGKPYFKNDAGTEYDLAAGSVLAAGSNSTDVAGITGIGGTSTYAPAAHWHKGVFGVTSSSSNTLQRPIVNLRAGSNVALTATDTDGSGEFDTVTIHSTGGGGSSSDPLASGKVTLTSGDLTTNNATMTDAAGLSITLTTGARRVLFGASLVGTLSAGSGYVAVGLNIDGTLQGGTNFGLQIHADLGAEYQNLSFTFLSDVLSAGSHTFKIQFRRSGGTTAKIFASDPAAHIWAQELPG